MGIGIKVLTSIEPKIEKNCKVVIQHKGGFNLHSSNEIIRLEADGNYTGFILTNNRKIITSRTLGEYEESLTSIGFYRIHQSIMINLDHLQSYVKGKEGKVELTDGSYFAVSRKRKPGFLALLSD